jgi:ubiquinone/menaquinone biosynthesis C-methylase UbiE
MPEISREAVTEQYGDASNLNARIALHQRFSTNHYGWQRWVYDQFELSAQSDILELGCGPADLWRENADRIPSGWHVTLSDFSPGMVSEAKANLCRLGRHFQFELIDAQSIPFGDRSFDAVIANHMLYHVPDKASALAEIRRVLKPGGRLYASTVGQTHMRELDALMVRFLPAMDPMFGASASSFLLENGEAQLTEWFSPVHTYRYEDALIVTEAEPLVAYALSSFAGIALKEDRLARFTRWVEDEIARHGAIHITKDSGLFEAVRPLMPGSAAR